MSRLIAVACALTLLGCSEDNPIGLAVDTALCARLQNGPATSLSASTSTTGAPSAGASTNGTRIDVTLPPQSRGSLAFDMSDGMRIAVGLSQDIEFVVKRNDGPVVVADELSLDGIVCSELVVRRLYSFEQGVYTMTLGPADADAVSFAFEPYPDEE